MTIHPLTLDNVVNLKSILGETFFKECELPGKFNVEVWHANWIKIMQANFGAIWVLEHNNEYVGALGGILSPDVSTGDIVATEAFWFVLPKYRGGALGIRLMFHFEKWALAMGAKRILMSMVECSIPERLNAFFIKRGYKRAEVAFIKEL